MLEEEGTVVRVHADMVEVVTRKKSACGSCAAKNGCGTSLVESLFPQRTRSFRASNEVLAKEGDRVIIGLDENALQIASMLVYLAPLLGLIAGAMAGSWLGAQISTGQQELFSILAGIGGFWGSLFVVRSCSDALSRKHAYQARVLRVLPEEKPVVTVMDLHGVSKG